MIISPHNRKQCFKDSAAFIAHVAKARNQVKKYSSNIWCILTVYALLLNDHLIGIRKDTRHKLNDDDDACQFFKLHWTLKTPMTQVTVTASTTENQLVCIMKERSVCFPGLAPLFLFP